MSRLTSRSLFTSLSLALSALLLASCSSPHFFPRTQPLFVGLNESGLSPRAQNALAKAKVDFRLAKHGETPQYAKLSHTVPNTQSKVYEGDGYRLTMVKEGHLYPRLGPEIVVASTITGGETYRYDEVDEIAD